MDAVYINALATADHGARAAPALRAANPSPSRRHASAEYQQPSGIPCVPGLQRHNAVWRSLPGATLLLSALCQASACRPCL